MMVDAGAVLTVMQALTPEDFYVAKHQMTCRAAFGLATRNVAIDPITLADELGRRKELHKVGGHIWISELLDAGVSAAAVEHHAAIVLEHARLRRLRTVEGFIRESVQDRKPADEIMEQAEASIFAMAARHDLTEYRSVADRMPGLVETISDRITNKRNVSGIPTGFIELDRLTLGFHKKELSVIAARPSVGKTAFGLNCCEAACRAGHSVAFLSLEMTGETLIERMLAGASKLDAQRVRAGYLNQAETNDLVEASAQVASLDIRIDDGAGQNAMKIRSKARRLMMQRPFDLLIVDYLQLIQSSGKADNRAQEVGLITKSLKELGKELGVAPVVLCQLKRPGKGQERQRPMLSDLKESGAIEEDADMVLMIHRPEMAEPDPEKRKRVEGVVECAIAKQRNGPVGFFNLGFKKEQVRFVNLADAVQERMYDQTPPPPANAEYSYDPDLEGMG